VEGEVGYLPQRTGSELSCRYCRGCVSLIAWALLTMRENASCTVGVLLEMTLCCQQYVSLPDAFVGTRICCSHPTVGRTGVSIY
jgi:hypothetical protein